MHPDVSAAGSYFFGLAFIILISITSHAISTPISLITVFLIIVCDILLAQTRNRAYKVATASFVTMIMSFTPVIVLFLSLGILGEKPDLIQLIGGLLIISTGFIAELVKI